MKSRTEPSTARAVYEVVLDNMPAELLRSRFPGADVRVTGVQSLVQCRQGSAAQLDHLIDQVMLLGLRLEEVHRVSSRESRVPVYEVRISGEVRPRLLSHLSRSHRFMADQTLVRIVAMASGLHQFLRACTADGASIQRVRRVCAVG